MIFQKIRPFQKIGGSKIKCNSLNYELSNSVLGLEDGQRVGSFDGGMDFANNQKFMVALALLVQNFAFPLVRGDNHGSQIFSNLLKKFHPTRKFLLYFLSVVKRSDDIKWSL